MEPKPQYKTEYRPRRTAFLPCAKCARELGLRETLHVKRGRNWVCLECHPEQKAYMEE